MASISKRPKTVRPGTTSGTGQDASPDTDPGTSPDTSPDIGAGARTGTATRAKGRKRSKRRGAVDALVIADELHRIDRLLRTLPDVTATAQLADRAGATARADATPGERGPTSKHIARRPEPADDLAEHLHQHGLTLDIPEPADPDAPDLADLPSAPATIIEAARWRVLRLARAVTLVGHLG